MWQGRLTLKQRNQPLSLGLLEDPPARRQSDALICTLLLPGKGEEEKYQS